MITIISRVLFVRFIPVFQIFNAVFTFFSVKHGRHFMNIRALARRILSENIHAPFPLLFRIIVWSTASSTNVGYIYTVVGESVILSSNVYLQISKYWLSSPPIEFGTYDIQHNCVQTPCFFSSFCSHLCINLFLATCHTNVTFDHATRHVSRSAREINLNYIIIPNKIP